MSTESHDPLNHTEKAKYHIQGLDPTQNTHYFEIYLDKEFADRLQTISLTDEEQTEYGNRLCEMFLDSMFEQVNFIDDTYLISKIKISDQAKGLHFHEETDDHIAYGTKNIDTHKECVEIISVFTKWVEYATRLIDKNDAILTENKSEEEMWEAHNESFNYDPPERPPEFWDSNQYDELIDRVIIKNEQWVCTHCSSPPFNSVEKARSHVTSQHQEDLLDTARQKADWEDNSDTTNGEDSDDGNDNDDNGKTVAEKKESNNQLTDF